jgi:hypothetical protein
VATAYVVLELTEDRTWREILDVEAHSADQAIRLAIDPDGKYVAIPSRKWHARGPSEATQNGDLYRLSAKAAE